MYFKVELHNLLSHDLLHIVSFQLQIHKIHVYYLRLKFDTPLVYSLLVFFRQSELILE